MEVFEEKQRGVVPDIILEILNGNSPATASGSDVVVVVDISV